jgi:hypothetical protein
MACPHFRNHLELEKPSGIWQKPTEHFSYLKSLEQRIIEFEMAHNKEDI